MKNIRTSRFTGFVREFVHPSQGNLWCLVRNMLLYAALFVAAGDSFGWLTHHYRRAIAQNGFPFALLTVVVFGAIFARVAYLINRFRVRGR